MGRASGSLLKSRGFWLRPMGKFWKDKTAENNKVRREKLGVWAYGFKFK